MIQYSAVSFVDMVPLLCYGYDFKLMNNGDVSVILNLKSIYLTKLNRFTYFRGYNKEIV